MTEIESILYLLEHSPELPAALATLVSVRGSSYRRPGARALLLADGQRSGSISGGCLEEDIAVRMGRVLESGRPETAAYDTTAENDLVWGIGLGCEGVVRVLIEAVPVPRPPWLAALAVNLREGLDTNLRVVSDGDPKRWGTFVDADFPAPPLPDAFLERIEPRRRLILFGAGDDAMPLARMATQVGWRVTVVDSRAAFASRRRFPDADVVVTSSASMDEHVELDSRSFVVVMSHRYWDDLSLLAILLARPLAYLGILGPRKRTERLLAQLRQEGAALDPHTLGNLCAPVGLDLGATLPETIALSILAEMQCRLTGRIPNSLRERTSAIHA